MTRKLGASAENPSLGRLALSKIYESEMATTQNALARRRLPLSDRSRRRKEIERTQTPSSGKRLPSGRKARSYFSWLPKRVRSSQSQLIRGASAALRGQTAMNATSFQRLGGITVSLFQPGVCTISKCYSELIHRLLESVEVGIWMRTRSRTETPSCGQAC
jgi:hypothetical protein